MHAHASEGIGEEAIPLALLLLADGRLPAGGHAHSSGMEQAVDDGIVADLESLEEVLLGRLETVGVLEARAAARACWLARRYDVTARMEAETLGTALADLDAAFTARLASSVARQASRAQGSAHARLGRRAFPDAAPLFDAAGRTPHLAVALGLLSAATGARPGAAAALAAYHAVAGPASAALRLLGLDPVGVTATIARLVRHAAALVAAAPGAGELPLLTSPVLEILHERHHERKERLFAS